MKKLINEVGTLVADMLGGLAWSNPGIALLQGHLVAVRSDIEAVKARGEVTLVSGGGSGHEPAHAGYIGQGMLSAAVCGDVFTSPSTDAVLAAVRAVAGPAGVLVIVKNYTGDRLNFGLAVELAKAEGIEAEMVVVADDAALAAGGDHAGRRGIAGTVLVHKVAGAAAALGLPLAAVKQAALEAIADVSSMGVALSPCTVPAAGRPGFELADTEVELGLGIHGEAGVRRVPMGSAATLVKALLDVIVADRRLADGDRVVLLANNLGSTPAQEVAIVTGSALSQLTARNIVVERVWSGSFLTALEMGGVSLSLMTVDDKRLALLDAPTSTMAWPTLPQGRVSPPRIIKAPASTDASRSVVASAVTGTPLSLALRAICSALIAAEEKLTRLDQIVGDGDLGISLARGSRAIEDELNGYPLGDLAGSLRAMSGTLRRALGGTSGPLYAIGLLRAAASLEASTAGPATSKLTVAAAALREAVAGISELGGAVEGDRTMLDAMAPAVRALEQAAAAGIEPAEGWARAVEAALQGSAATAERVARRGRSSYLGERARGHADPGAEAIVIWMQALEPFIGGGR
ncbi:dihydroxyacetone kinase family protein [soil metagenome]